MAIPSPFAYGQRPDYIGGVGEALGGAAKTAESLSPAHPLIANAMRRIYGGEDPRRVAIETKFRMAREQPPPPNLPDAGPQMGTAPATSAGSFTGPAEFSSEETVVGQLPPQPRGSMPLSSEPSTGGAFYSQAQPPILNRDLPVLMQGAGLAQKENKGDLNYLNYLLNVDRFGENRRQFDEQAGLRAAREGSMRATTAALPTRLDQANQRLDIARDAGARGWANLGQREAIKYMERASDLAIGSSALKALISQGEMNPEIAPQSDYVTRRTADIAARIPFVGPAVGGILEHVADDALTQPQRDWRRSVRLYFQTMLVHPQFGASFTANEQAIANELAGGQVSIADTIAAMRAFERMTGVKLDMWNRALPGAAQRVGPPGRNLIPPSYSGTRDAPAGSLPALPGEAGPSLQDELQNAPQPRRLRGTVTDEGTY